LQVEQHQIFSAQAQEQKRSEGAGTPLRGEILTGDNFPLALSKNTASIYASPRRIKDPQNTAEILADLLNLDYDLIFSRLNKADDPYEPILNKASDEEARAVAIKEIEGIKISYAGKRYYPNAGMASHLLGYVDQGGKGRYGIEGFYEEELQKGKALTLTIDYLLQHKAEEELAALTLKYRAQSGSIIILDPQTGEIKALASWPNFDPNNYQEEKDISVFLNPIINSQFEPGSIVKVLTIAAGLDSGAIKLEDSYYDQGVREISGYEVHNFDKKSYGHQTISQIIEKSLNLGAIFISEQMPKKEFKDYLKDFGLGQKTGIKLYGELPGNLDSLSLEVDINYATAAFGQGISATPLQMAMAISTLANDGYLLAPRIFSNEEKAVKRQVVSSFTARALTQMMSRAFKSYPGAEVLSQYNIAAKTGTAQVANQGGYSEDQWIHSLVGFAPVEDPRFLIFLKLDQPREVKYAATSLTPSFIDLSGFLLQYYKVAPRPE